MNDAKVTVTITGGTTVKRAELGSRINLSENGLYVLKPRTTPVVVVCNDASSEKAERYISNGAVLMTEDELLECLREGRFPLDPIVRAPTTHRYSDIDWKDWNRPPKTCRLEYVDADDQTISLTVEVERSGVNREGYEYLGVYDGGQFKTLRTDRILRADYL